MSEADDLKEVLEEWRRVKRLVSVELINGKDMAALSSAMEHGKEFILWAIKNHLRWTAAHTMSTALMNYGEFKLLQNKKNRQANVVRATAHVRDTAAIKAMCAEARAVINKRKAP